MENGFKELNVIEEIVKALDEINITNPSEIQAKAIPVMLENYDLIASAQTGTGKTFAYAIPVVTKINKNEKDIKTLVLCPTRELAIQVTGEIEKLIKYLPYISVATVYGGESYERQIKNIKRRPQIVVGTPGRIIDLINKNVLNFNYIDTLVLDEADEMLKMGFEEDLETILKTTPSSRQTALFSATMPEWIKKVASKYQHSPMHISIKKKTLTVDKIKQDLYFCKRESKDDLLVRILDFYDFKNCIIFANTKAKVDDLVLYLQKNNYLADGIHGDLKQLVRDRVMRSFKNGNIKILVATDVAARGIDISGLEAIINYDLPQEDEIYVHRIGRTGRAGEAGHSITFASPMERRKVRDIESYTKKNMDVCQIPSAIQINEKLALSMYDKIVGNLESKMDDNYIILNKLASLNIDSGLIINSMLNLMLEKKRKEYKKIESIAAKRENKFDKKIQSSSPRKTDFIYAHLNIGKKELLRPQILLSFIEREGGVKKSNVGEIVIRKSGTNLEITKGAYAYLKKMEGKKYQGTRLSVRKAFSLDE